MSVSDDLRAGEATTILIEDPGAISWTESGVVVPRENVTALHRPPDPDVIAKLEELLESAKSGELQAVVVFESNDKRDVYTHWAGDMPLGDLLLAIELHRAKSIEKYLEAAGRIE